jgi:hypothetical protein
MTFACASRSFFLRDEWRQSAWKAPTHGESIWRNHNDALIIGNPGLLPSERYISEAQADIECVFESDTGFGDFTPADWMANYSADRFCALLLGVASLDAMRDFLVKALNDGTW